MAWKLDRIVIKDEDLQLSWTFVCQAWFTKDNRHECEFVYNGYHDDRSRVSRFGSMWERRKIAAIEPAAPADDISQGIASMAVDEFGAGGVCPSASDRVASTAPMNWKRSSSCGSGVEFGRKPWRR